MDELKEKLIREALTPIFERPYEELYSFNTDMQYYIGDLKEDSKKRLCLEEKYSECYMDDLISKFQSGYDYCEYETAEEAIDAIDEAIYMLHELLK